MVVKEEGLDTIFRISAVSGALERSIRTAIAIRAALQNAAWGLGRGIGKRVSRMGRETWATGHTTVSALKLRGLCLAEGTVDHVGVTHTGLALQVGLRSAPVVTSIRTVWQSYTRRPKLLYCVTAVKGGVRIVTRRHRRRGVCHYTTTKPETSAHNCDSRRGRM